MNTSSLRLVTLLAIVVALAGSNGTHADTITVGSQQGAQIFFNNVLTRTYNFGVTQTGAQSGLSVSSIDVNVKGGNAQSNLAPVLVSIYSGLGGTGSVMATGTIPASSLTSQFEFLTVPISTTNLTSGGYSVVLTTTNLDNYYIKNGATKLTTNGTTAVTSSYWVEDTNTEGTAGTSLNASGTVLATWTLGTNAMAFGNYRVGATLSATTPIVNTALVTSNTVTQALAVSATQSGGVSSISGLPSPYLSVGGTANLVAGLNGGTTGPNTGTASLTFQSVPGTSLTTGTTAVGSGAIALSGTGWNWANASYSGTAFAFGYLHRGAAAASGTVTIGNQAVASASYQDSLDVSAATGNPLVAATGFNGLTASSGGATRDNLVVAASTGTAGSLASTVALTLVSNANGIAGLSNGSATVQGTPGSITTTGTVYTGQSTWTTNGSGQWGTLSSQFGTNWNWSAFDGSPGVDPGFADTDTATFGNAVTSGTATVTITSATASVRSLTFDNGAAGYALAGASGGSLRLLNAGTSAAAVAVNNGTHSLAVPVTFGSDVAVNVASGAYLQMSGGASGAKGLTKAGGGILEILGSNDYTAATLADAGVLKVNGVLSDSDVSIAALATLMGSGTMGGNVTVAGTHSPGNSPGIQTVAGDLTYVAGSTVVWELIDDTVTGRGTNFDGINVSGALDFSGATSLDLVFNLAGSGVDWSDSFWATSHEGVNGWLVYTGAESLANFGNLMINGSDWADGNGTMLQTARSGASFGLYQDGTDVYLTYAVAVPEPSTLVLAGLGLTAAAVARRRRARS